MANVLDSVGTGVSEAGLPAAPHSYGSPGPYHTGVWLVVLNNGAAAIYNHNYLPKSGTAPTEGKQYYWLGNSPKMAADRIGTAINHLNLDIGTIPDATAIGKAFTGHPVGLNFDWNPKSGTPLPFSGSDQPPPTAPGATYDQGPLGFLSFLGDIKFWIRFMEAVVGAVLIFLGLRALTGNGTGNPADAVARVAKRVA